MFGIAALTPMLFRWIVGIGFVIALITGFFYFKHSVEAAERDRVNSIWVKKEADATVAAVAELNKKNAEISKRQAELVKSQNEIVAKNRELQNATKSYNDLLRQYADDTKRLSVHIATNKTDTATKSGNTTTSPRVGENTVELMPDVSTEILDFARGYQENLRLKNECIDLYNAARTSVNAN